MLIEMLLQPLVTVGMALSPPVPMASAWTLETSPSVASIVAV